MTAKKPKKMVALKVLETSGVDHPAHLEEGWIVMKNATATEDPMPADDEIIEIDDTNLDRVVELEAELAKAREQIAALTKSVDATDPEDDAEEGDEELLKSLPEPVRQMLAKAQSEADNAREELRKEREIQRDREFVAKAQGWSNLQIDAAELGVALRKVADINADIVAVIERSLDAANEQQEAAAIFSELGKSTSAASGNAFGKVQSLAKAAVANGDFATVEQAISGLIAKNPDLYTEYLSEQR